ncbi:MAG: GNAT family N-acetyltransferase [Chloroflexi bacterium]|nr:GNAT family N-acetyltransferase [Chloroflexota bacterium]
MTLHDALSIVSFEPEHQSPVRALILAGLAERWGVLDPARNGDLEDIAFSYRNADVLVALLGDRVVGAGVCVPRSPAVGEIVRMSVAGDLRRHGIGRAVLQTLCVRAQTAGLTRIVLETTATWDDAIRFYLRYGFQMTHAKDGDVYFALDLSGHHVVASM